MTPAALERALNRWLSEYSRNPRQFQSMRRTLAEYREDKRKRRKPRFGRECMMALLEFAKEKK